MTRRICHFSGRVQGVGFRYTVQNVAMQFNVRGYVKNLPDGKVEMVAEGPEDQVEGLIDAIKGRMDSFISRVDSQSAPPNGEFADFSIRH